MTTLKEPAKATSEQGDAPKRTKIDRVLDAFERAIVERTQERAREPSGTKKFHHADGARDGLLEAKQIVENIKEYGHA